MNTSELECILSRAIRRCQFLGVHAADRAPLHLPVAASEYPCAYVVNTDPEHAPGKHWVAFYATSPGQLEFFDSYGRPPLAYPHIRLPANVVQINYNGIELQSRRSTVCGHYCIFYLLKRADWSRTFLLNTLKRFKNSTNRLVRPGQRHVPYPQDKLVRRFVRNTVVRLDLVRCCSALHRCGGGQCCKARSTSHNHSFCTS
jgi:hypothetical protein